MAKKEKTQIEAPKKQSVKRKFYYYGYTIMYMDNQTNQLVDYKDDAMKNLVNDVFQKISKLEYREAVYDQSFLVHQNADGNYVYVIIDEQLPDLIKFRLLLCRDKLLPYIEKKGSITPLSDLLGDTQRIAEVTHCVIFVNEKIIGVEYNFAGPKIKDLSEYITNKSDENIIQSIHFTNKVNLNTLKKLHSAKELSLFDIKVENNSEVIAELIKADSSFEALNCKKNNIDTIEFVLKTKMTKNKKGFTLDFLNPQWVAELLKKHKSDISRFKVKYGYGTEEVDLLSENYVCSSSFIPVQSTRTIDKDDAYATMISYYNTSVQKYFTNN